MNTDEILQVVGAIYQATLDEEDPEEELEYIRRSAGIILGSRIDDDKPNRGLKLKHKSMRPVEQVSGKEAKRRQARALKGMTIEETLRTVCAVYSATLGVAEGDERAALDSIHDAAGFILDAHGE